MSEDKTMRLNSVLRELNISLDRAVEFLVKNGHEIEARPTTKISQDTYQVLLDGFETDASKKAASKEVGEEKRKEKEAIRFEIEAKLEKKRVEDAKKEEEVLRVKADKFEFKTVGKIDLNKFEKSTEVNKVHIEEQPIEVPKQVIKTKEEIIEVKKEVVEKKKEEIFVGTKKLEQPIVKTSKPSKIQEKGYEVVEEIVEITAENAEPILTQYKKLDGPKMTGQTVDLKQFERPKKKNPEVKKETPADVRKKRKRITKLGTNEPNIRSQENSSRPNQPNQSNQGGQRSQPGQGNNRPPSPFRPRATQAPIKKEDTTEADIQKQVRETLEKLQGKSSRGKGAKYRRDKRTN